MRRWVRLEPGCWRPERKTRSGAISARLWLVGPVLKPPSSATSRGESPSRWSSATGARQQRVLGRVAGRRGGRQDEPARAALGVFSDLRELGDVAELVGLAELALADRAC